MSAPVRLDDVREAAARLEGVAVRTPVLASAALDERVGAEVLLKCESLQRTGAFKIRGAYNAISPLSAGELERGVCAPSSGNHAQAVALAARLLGSRATLVMPTDAPASKLEATRGHGAEIVVYDRYSEDRAAIAAEIAEREGLTIIPPYDHPDVIAGQGTVALELIEEAPGLDALVVPVGGGGLLAGCATVAAALSAGTRMIGVEPELGDDTRRSLAAGERISIPTPRTIADGQSADAPGELTFEINRELVGEIAVVSDEEIVDAMAFLFDRVNVVAEPSGATAVAALLSGRLSVSGRVGAIVTGGNVDTERFRSLLTTRHKRRHPDMPWVPMREDARGRVEYRAAAPADAPALRAIVDAAYGHYVERIRDRPKPMDADYDEVVRTRSVTVADDGGEIVGLVVHGPDDDGYLIDNVAVTPDRQGEGIGLELIGRAERSAARAGFESVRLYTHELMTDNRALYARLGYVEYGERLVLHGRVKLLRKAVGEPGGQPA